MKLQKKEFIGNEMENMPVKKDFPSHPPIFYIAGFRKSIVWPQFNQSRTQTTSKKDAKRGFFESQTTSQKTLHENYEMGHLCFSANSRNYLFLYE